MLKKDSLAILIAKKMKPDSDKPGLKDALVDSDTRMRENDEEESLGSPYMDMAMMSAEKLIKGIQSEDPEMIVLAMKKLIKCCGMMDDEE